MNPEDSTFKAFGEQAANLVNSGLTALALSLGNELGLVNLLCKGFAHPFTVQELAVKARLKERYVKDWLGCMVAANLVQIRVHGDISVYEIPEDHRKHVIYAAEMSSAIGLFARRQGKIKECFQLNGPTGFSYSEFPETLDCRSGFRLVTVADACDKDIIPALGEFRHRLGEGCRVLDVGCGTGCVLLHLAKRFPQSSFVGLDCSTEALRSAHKFAIEDGTSNVTFQEGDVTLLKDSWTRSFDWVLLYMVLHDLANPKKALFEIGRALKKDGILSVIDESISSKHEDNKGNIAAAGLYAHSIYSCLPCSMNNEEYDGSNPGIGADNMEFLLTDCGFEIKNKKFLTQEPDSIHFVCNFKAV